MPHRARKIDDRESIRRQAGNSSDARGRRRTRNGRLHGSTRPGSVWTTDKDGIVAALPAAEITARMGRDAGEMYSELTREFGEPAYDRVEAPATSEEEALLETLSPQHIRTADLAGERIQTILTSAPGNGSPIGGVKVVTESGWFAARPSGTEDIYKIYAESFRGRDHLRRILEDAQTIVNDALASPGRNPGGPTARTTP